MADGDATAAAILACSSVDDARRRPHPYPAIIEAALQQGPSEEVFRAHWAPGAAFHESLRQLLSAVAVQVAVTPPPQKAPEGRDPFGAEPEAKDPFGAAVDALDEKKEEKPAEEDEEPSVPTETVRLARTANGDFWGFCCNKDMKIVLVNDNSPASRAGLKAGKLWVWKSCGQVCLKPSDAYGPPDRGLAGMLALELTCTRSKVDSARPARAPPKPQPEEYDTELLPAHLRAGAGGAAAAPAAERRRRSRSRDRDRDRDPRPPAGYGPSPGWDKGWPPVRVPGHPWSVCELPPPGSSPAANQQVGSDLALRLVFLAMGSSNMAGRARLQGNDLATERAFMLDARGRWQPAREPMNPHDGRGEGAGPQSAFARRLVQLLPSHAGVFIVPCACADTTADDWQQGSSLFTAAMKRAKLGAEACDGIISGVIWHLGEADAGSSEGREGQLEYRWVPGRQDPGGETKARLVGSKTVTICHAVRAELNMPDLPFVTGQLFNAGPGGQHNTSYSCQLINASYSAMAGEHMDVNMWTKERGRKGPWSTEATKHVRCVSSEGLCSMDKCHFDLTSIMQLGKRYADHWWGMEGHNFPDQRRGLTWGGGD